jgi:hypothetical protein
VTGPTDRLQEALRGVAHEMGALSADVRRLQADVADLLETVHRGSDSLTLRVHQLEAVREDLYRDLAKVHARLDSVLTAADRMQRAAAGAAAPAAKAPGVVLALAAVDIKTWAKLGVGLAALAAALIAALGGS